MGLFNLFKKYDSSISIPRDDKEIWFRDTYAIWADANCTDFHHIAGSEYDRGYVGDMKYILRRDWGIHNRQETLDMVKKLKSVNGKQKGELAWDLCRATQILAMAYIGGYFTREDANSFSTEVAIIMQANYRSWDELLSNYMAGFEEWALYVYEELDAKDAIEKRREVYNNIKNSNNPPYQIDWNLKFD